MKNKNSRIYIMLGFQTHEHSDYSWLQNKLSGLTNKQKYKFLEMHNIPFHFEDSQEKINELKEQYYYIIQFDIPTLAF